MDLIQMLVGNRQMIVDSVLNDTPDIIAAGNGTLRYVGVV